MPRTSSDVTKRLRMGSRRKSSVQRVTTFVSVQLPDQTVMFIDLQEFTSTCAKVGSVVASLFTMGSV